MRRATVALGLALTLWGCGGGDTPPGTTVGDVGGGVGGSDAGGEQDTGPRESECMDGRDDDGDGLIDCSDPDCVGALCSEARAAWCVNLQCAGGEDRLECADGLDNDADGLADCDDPDCGNSCACGQCEEVCDDGRDNDEDGAIDEGCPCTFRNLDRGVCVDGSRQPDASCAPPPSYQPAESLCDGLDNDCDGVVDEGCACRFRDRPNGVCLLSRVNVQGECGDPVGFQATEASCDGFDNDCDGNTDEGCAICDYTGTSVGVCQYGVPGATVDECTPPAAHQPDERACDNLDNDCDGFVDEGCPCAYLSLSAGVCARATLPGDGTCSPPENYEADETSCDGFDNDCDGAVDEGCQACRFQGSSTGVCAFGVTGADVSECSAPSAYQADEAACDGLDNDCDGVFDEGCSCLFASSDRGVCAAAVIGADSGVCAAPDGYSSVEIAICDGLDNDCDGIVDEGCSCAFMGIADGVCANSTIDVDGGFCARPVGYFPSEETGGQAGGPACDGRDNDCDGAVDEGCSCDFLNRPFGACDGAVRDADGVCTQPPEFRPEESAAECAAGTNDGIDNDCNGVVDDNCAKCDYLGDGQGVCANGVPDGAGGCDQPTGYEGNEGPATGTCDGLDNNCDGYTDEGCPCDFDDTPVGVCAGMGVRVRDNVGRCPEPTGYEADETSCDGLDNDCDGVVDEGCLCDFGGVDQGVCVAGGRVNALGACAIEPGVRYDTRDEGFEDPGLCDGLDNDCDGVDDEGCACDFNGLPDGVCRFATRDAMGACVMPLDYEGDEMICDGLDNDCDGVVDEGCPCNFGGLTDGVCVTTRNPAGECKLPPNLELPKEASCGDGFDNDCDGDMDGADADCGMMGMREVCDNGVDDDNDGLIDCDDPECDGLPCGHVLFVTSQSVDGTFDTGGDARLGDADAICQGAAQSGGLGGTFKAILSGDGVDARARIQFRGDVFNNDGINGRQKVFGPGDFFSNSNAVLTAGFGYDESGASFPDIFYWTGSTSTGFEDSRTCMGWSVGDDTEEARVGEVRQAGTAQIGDHISKQNEKCDQFFPVLCISGQQPEDCLNPGDDDKDGYDDMTDPDCGPTMPVMGEICDNGFDDDNDGHVDCSDDECAFGACDHTVFATSAPQFPLFDGVGQTWADDTCQGVADAQALGGVWRAVFSTDGVAARDRILIRGAIRNNDLTHGVVMAGEEFFSGTAAPTGVSMAFDESGNAFAQDTWVWTGSTDTGGVATGETCANWTSAMGIDDGAVGLLELSGASSGDYLNTATRPCDDSTVSFLCINGQRPEACDRPGSQDGDALDDSLDPDCAKGGGSEVCDNGLDDDDDGYTDLDDADCTAGAVTMFTTFETYTGDLGGLGGADAICQESARRANRYGSFRAVLSDSSNDARSRVDIDREVYNTDTASGPNVCFDHDGFLVPDAEFYTPAVGSPHFTDGAIGFDEVGGAISGAPVWSGSTETGFRDTTRTCMGWSAESSGSVGRVGYASGTQAPVGGENLAYDVGGGTEFVTCDTPNHLVCVGGQPRETLCEDTTDDDGDGLVDCADPDCGADPACALRLFVTSTTYAGGALGSLNDLDAECAMIAGNLTAGSTTYANGVAVAADTNDDLPSRLEAALGGTGRWLAVRSADADNGNPIAFYSIKELVEGEAPESSLAFYEDGSPIPTGVFVWTGMDGTLAPSPDHCQDWASSSSNVSGEAGDPFAGDNAWVSTSLEACNKALHLYCLAIP